jgi:hypothetical protein
MMSGAPALGKNVGINAFSVVADSQPKMPVAILDCHFDARRLCVAPSIAHRFATDTVDFLAYNWRKFPRGPFPIHVQFGAWAAGLPGPKFLSKRSERFHQIVVENSGGTQSLYRIPALGDRLPGLVDYTLKPVPRLWAVREQVCHRMKFQQRCLKTLKQGVVEIPSDTRPFGQPLFKKQI